MVTESGRNGAAGIAQVDGAAPGMARGGGAIINFAAAVQNVRRRRIEKSRLTLPVGSLDRLLLSLRERPSDPILLREIGHLYLERASGTVAAAESRPAAEDFTRARKALERALKSVSGVDREASRLRGLLCLDLGLLHARMEVPERAVAFLDAAIRTLKNDLDAYEHATINLALALAGIGSFREATRRAIEAGGMTPDHPWFTSSRFFIASWYFDLDDPATAHRIVAATLAVAPCEDRLLPRLLLIFAAAAGRLNRLREAEIAVEALLALPGLVEDLQVSGRLLLFEILARLNRQTEAAERLAELETIPLSNLQKIRVITIEGLLGNTSKKAELAAMACREGHTRDEVLAAGTAAIALSDLESQTGDNAAPSAKTIEILEGVARSLRAFVR